MDIKTILTATDFSDLSDKAARTAASLAKNVGARLILVHVFDPPMIFEDDEHAMLDPQGTETEHLQDDLIQSRLEELAGELGSEGVEVVPRFVTDGRVPDQVEQVAEDEGADLIVLATHGRRGLSRMILGSITLEILHVTRVPVLAIHPDATSLDDVKNIVLPTDFSAASKEATRHAVEWAKHFNSEIWAIHALDRPSSYAYDPLLREYRPITDKGRVTTEQEKRLDRLENELEAAGVRAETALVQGGAAPCILATAEQHHAELIIMGSRGHTPLGRLLLGSVADRVLRTATCAVLAVPPPEED